MAKKEEIKIAKFDDPELEASWQKLMKAMEKHKITHFELS